MKDNQPHVILEEITDLAKLSEAKALRQQFDQNAAWLESHVSEVYSTHRGKCICIAGQELFAADTASEALAKATAAHPQDKGRFVQYIPKEKVARIYAY